MVFAVADMDYSVPWNRSLFSLDYCIGLSCVMANCIIKLPEQVEVLQQSDLHC